MEKFPAKLQVWPKVAWAACLFTGLEEITFPTKERLDTIEAYSVSDRRGNRQVDIFPIKRKLLKLIVK